MTSLMRMFWLLNEHKRGVEIEVLPSRRGTPDSSLRALPCFPCAACSSSTCISWPKTGGRCCATCCRFVVVRGHVEPGGGIWW